MKSQQINFFLSPEEFGRLSDLVHSLGFVILKSESPVPEPGVLPDFGFDFPVKVFALPEQLDMLFFRPGKDCFIVDELRSPIISFWENHIQEKKLHRGRFYFVKDFANGEMKNAEFLKKSQALFKLFKKTFPDAALEGFAPFWVSPKAAELHRQGYELKM